MTHAYFETNRKDSKKLWHGIKTLVSNKTSKKGSQLTLHNNDKLISEGYIALITLTAFLNR